jgi:ATP-dependent exoDNAse (exonuclease V) beta subunit
VEALLGKDRAAALHALLARRAPAPGAESIAAPVAGGFDQWREVAALLLTTKGEWRQRFTKREGFGGDAGQLRETLESLMTGFRATAGLREALAEVTALPPAGLGAPQHEVLAALGPVLRRLLAELKLAFAGAGSVDHAELALAAQEALGAVDAPSELLLALDRRIEHILVDEFQDTSHLQWGLLERLTAGWQSGDGRSLFLVGDPMQSIYRFRDADLSLFLRAREEGIGALRLEPVRLAVNYRSAAELVDWVNATFPALFTPAGDVEGQGPGFTGATSGLGNKAGAGVSLETLPVDSHAEEIARVVEIVKAETSTRPQQSIGILVRNRTHLAGLRAALMRDQLAAHAVEIDSPVDTELGLDLLALTSALLHAGDRLAWLALLRGPCCGLDWRDLERLVDGGGERTIRELLDDPGRRASLSADGEKRAQWLLERLHVGDGLRAGRTLGAWIRECWMLIDGPACLSGPDEIGLAESFFLELDALGLRGDVDDPAVLSRAFSRPASGAVARQTGIEIMTIHKAKGLEFDTVIVPGLSRGGGRDSSKLLLLHDFTLQNGERICLMAGAAAGDDPLQSFLRRAARAEERRERARLLYVAATRAKRRLCLLARVSERNRRQRSDSLFALLAAPPGAVAGRAPSDELVEESPDMEQEPEALRELPLERLRFDDAVPWPPSARVEETPDRRARPEFEWAHPASAQVGTLIHRELQRLCERSAAAGELLRPQGPVTRHRRELALLGIEPEDVGAAAERVREALERIWSDPAGRKILHPWPEAWSELRISCHGGDRIEHLRIDRSFVDADGVRWIIDYKSGRHLGADVEAFLDSELARYRPQLERYAEVVAAIDPRPIRVGLYFPLLQRQRDWVPAVSAGR